MEDRYLLFGLCASVIILSGCTVPGGPTPATSDQPQPGNLSVQKVFFAVKSAEGELQRIPEPILRPGSSFNMVLLGVREFERGEDGLHEFDIDLEVLKVPGYRTVFSKQAVLGESGHRNLTNGTATTPSVLINTSPNGEGAYVARATIYDEVSGRQVTVTKSFFLKPEEAGNKTENGTTKS